jgi:hypothetical protein
MLISPLLLRLRAFLVVQLVMTFTTYAYKIVIIHRQLWIFSKFKLVMHYHGLAYSTVSLA